MIQISDIRGIDKQNSIRNAPLPTLMSGHTSHQTVIFLNGWVSLNSSDHTIVGVILLGKKLTSKCG